MSFKLPNRRTGSSAGFTLIEVMIGILIMAATSVSMFHGISYARSQIRKVVIQERALEELRSEMDYWVARIMDGQFSGRDLQGDLQGTPIVLYNPDSNDPMDREYFEARIYREPIHKEYTVHDLDKNPYYELTMYIQWADHLGDPNAEPMEIRMSTSVGTVR